MRASPRGGNAGRGRSDGRNGPRRENKAGSICQICKRMNYTAEYCYDRYKRYNTSLRFVLLWSLAILPFCRLVGNIASSPGRIFRVTLWPLALLLSPQLSTPPLSPVDNLCL